MAPLLRLTWSAPLLGLLLAAQPEPPSAPPPDLKTEDGVRAALDKVEARYESACAGMAEAAIRSATGEMKPDASAARAALADVYADPQLAAILSVWVPRRTLARDSLITRRIRIWHKSWLVASVHLDAVINARADGIASKLARYDYRLNGKPVSRADLQAILESEPDRERRRLAWLALAAPAVQMHEDVLGLIRDRRKVSSGAGFRYVMGVLGAEDLRHPTWFLNLLGQLVDRSEPEYEALLASIRSELALESLEPWDLDHGLWRLERKSGAADLARRHFPAEGAIPAVRKLLAGLGFEPAPPGLSLQEVDLDRPAFAVPVKIPSDVRLLIDQASIRKGAPGGPELYAAILAEYGRALQALLTRRTSPIMAGYPWVPGTRQEAWSDGVARTFAGFLDDPAFLRGNLGMSEQETAIWQEARRARAILDLRRDLLALAVDLSSHTGDLDGFDASFRTVGAKFLRVSPRAGDPSPWPLSDGLVHGPPGAHNAVLGRSIAGESHRLIREALGERRLTSRKTAGWIVESLLGDGEALPFEERLAKAFPDGGFSFNAWFASVGISVEPSD